MGDGVLKKIAEYIRAHKLERKWQITLTSLGAVVVFCTTYALILPALTLEKDKTATASDAEEDATASDADYDPEADIELINDLETEEDLATDSDWYLPDMDLLNDLESGMGNGVWSQDLLAVAQSQIGYTEGSDGYSVYGDYFGRPYDEWNALFVNFCLEYAGIPKEQIPRRDAARELAKEIAASKQGMYREAGDYTPKPGDLVFLDTDGDGKIDRVGVVSEYSDGADGTIVVIEGDTGYTGGKASASNAEEADEELNAAGASASNARAR